jgi:multiple sugar transport system permease protein
MPENVMKLSHAITARNRRVAYLFLAPNLIGFLVFTLIPVICVFILSFMEWDSNNPAVFVGLSNFIKLIKDSNFLIALKNTIIYTLGTVTGIVILSLLLAILLNKGILFPSFWRAAHYIPYISSMIATAIVWQFLFNVEMGPINQFLIRMGITNPPRWLSSAQWALPSVMVVNVWRNIGRYMIIYLGGLQGIPRELYEAATVDGASKLQQFFHVTVPTLSSITFFVVITNIIGSFQVFSSVYIMTSGGPGRATSVLVYLIYREAFVNSRFGYASAMSTILFICIFAFTLIQFRNRSKSVHNEK